MQKIICIKIISIHVLYTFGKACISVFLFFSAWCLPILQRKIACPDFPLAAIEKLPSSHAAMTVSETSSKSLPIPVCSLIRNANKTLYFSCQGRIRLTAEYSLDGFVTRVWQLCPCGVGLDVSVAQFLPNQVEDDAWKSQRSISVRLSLVGRN